jgi:hypothetical protein
VVFESFIAYQREFVNRTLNPNKSATGKRGIRVLFNVGHACPAVPERHH